MTIIEPKVTLEWASPNPEIYIEAAARTSYKSKLSSDPESRSDFIRRIVLKNGHESVVEHAVASVRIITDRGISHEIVRHRLASYTQESTRYVNYTKDRHGKGDLKFVYPVGLSETQKRFFDKSYMTYQMLYNEAIASGMIPEQARYLLPEGTKTEMVMTANAREWRHFLKVRTAKEAHPNMIVVANKVLEVLNSWCPILFPIDS